MLSYILDEWIPWHRDVFDLSLLDINKYVLLWNFFSGVISVLSNVLINIEFCLSNVK